MKRISTLSVMMLLFCLSAMAQIELGAIKFSLGEGKKISATTGKISVSFPEATGIEDPTATTFVLEGNFGNEDLAFDGVEGTFASGVVFDLADFGIEPAKDYTLKITTVKVNGENLAPAEGYALNFKTRGAERKMSWKFQTDAATEAMIAEKIGTDANDYWKYATKGPRIQSQVKFVDEEVTIDGTTVIPFLEDLYITTASSDCMLLGATEASTYNRLHLAKKGNKIVIPDCRVGDVIDIKFGYVDTKSEYSLQIPGTISESATNEAKDSVQSPKSPSVYRFESQVDGDLTVYVNNSVVLYIEITEGMPKVSRNYNVVAAYVDGDNTTVLKELVGKTEGMTGSTIKANYPYWLADADGNVYTHGTKGNEFVESFDLKNNGGENEDTTFVINYKKTDYTGVVYLSEGEEIQNAVECSHANAAIRASNCKAGYVLEDTKLVTLQPGTYKIRAVIFDANKTPGYVVTLTKGEGELNEIYLSASATNWTETESDLLTITEPTDIVLKAGGSGTTGLDAIIIYASTDAPDDPDAIIVAKAGQKAAVRKVAKAGQIIIESEAGAFNAAGAQVK